MAKKKRPRRTPPPKKASAEAATERAIAAIAAREGKPVETIRLHMKLAMMSGLLNDDPVIKANWARIPRVGEVPTPEEVIAFYAGQLNNP